MPYGVIWVVVSIISFSTSSYYIVSFAISEDLVTISCLDFAIFIMPSLSNSPNLCWISCHSGLDIYILRFIYFSLSLHITSVIPNTLKLYWLVILWFLSHGHPEPRTLVKTSQEMPASSNGPKKPCIATSSSFQFVIAVCLCWFAMPCIFSSTVSYPFYYRPAMNKLSLHHLHGLAGFCPVSGSPLPDDPHTRFYSQLQSVTGQVTSGITHHCHWDPRLMGTPERIRGLVRHWEDAIWIPRKRCSIFEGDALDRILFWHQDTQ